MNHIILDVRTRNEFSKVHIPKAINFPVNPPPITLQKRAMIYNDLVAFMQEKGIPKSTLILVYCKKGIRSSMVVDMLRMMGYKNVINLGGVYPF